MSECHKIAIVEDESMQRMLLTKVLGKQYSVCAFETGEAFLAALPAVDVVLLDIEMPGINGFVTCQQLRADLDHGQTPVIFISSHDTTAERVAAYEAGGDDFLVKPLNIGELQHKIAQFIRQQEREAALAEQSSFASKTAFSAMSSMGELGVVLEFMRRSFACQTYQDVAEALLATLQAYDLRGTVQVRGQYGVCDQVSDNSYHPLQASVVETLAQMGRIVQFRSRVIVNYPQVSLLVHNLPLEDEERVGRLRDHLTTLVEGADARVQALDVSASLVLQQQQIAAALHGIRTSMEHSSVHALNNRNRSQDVLSGMSDRIEREFTVMGLTEYQEGLILGVINDAGSHVLSLFDEAADIEKSFTDVIKRMENLVGLRPVPTAEASPQAGLA